MHINIKKYMIRNAIPIIFSFAASICWVLALEILPVAKNEVSYVNSPLVICKIENIFFFFIFFFLAMTIWYLGYWLVKYIQVKWKKEEGVYNRKIIFIMSSTIFFSWSICWMTYFPGVAMNDTINMVKNPLSCAATQPLFYSLIVNGIMHSMKNITGNLMIGWATFVLGQMIVFVAIIIFGMCLLVKKKVRKEFVLIYVAYYALIPINADYAIAVVKDSMYAYATFLFIICLVQIEDSTGEWLSNRLNCNVFIMSAIAMAFTRNNGKIILIIALIYCAIKWKNKFGVIIHLLLLITMISFFVNTIVFNASSEQCSFRESMSVPLIQMGAVIANDGVISDEQKERLNEYLPIELWKENYRFSFTDPIKFSSEFDNKYLNDNKMDFLMLWTELGIQNIKIYIKSYLYHTYGFWNLITDVDWASPGGQSVFFKTCNNTRNASQNEYVANNGLENINLWPEKYGQVIDDFYLWGCNFFGIGQVFWIYVLFWSYLIKDRKYKYILINVILLLNWLSMMVAAPTSNPVRYLYLLILILPFMLLVQLEPDEDKNKEYNVNIQ